MPAPLPNMQRLLDIMARLRDKDAGCPWDIEQNFTTIAPYTIEEAYEVADAIQKGDMQELRSELGDLLLQVVFHSQMAREQSLFDFEAVAESIADKMIARHPHVFGNMQIGSAAEQTANWENIKAAERSRKPSSSSILADIPAALPALMRAIKLQNRAARVGFDWPDREQVYSKLAEELQEVRDASTPDEQAEEIGDLLFVVANLARHLSVDAEDALRAANRKFERRFGYIETQMQAQGRTLEHATLDEMETLWVEAKRKEKAA